MSTWRIQNILVIWWIGPKERTNKSEMPQSYQNSTKASMFFCSYYKTQSNATKQEYHPSLYLLKLIKNWQAICCCPTRQVGSTKERTPNGRNPQCCNTQRIIRFQFILSRTNNAKKITQTRREPIGEPQFQEQEGAPQSQKPRNGEMLTRGGGSRGSGGGQWSQTWLSPQEVEDRVGGGHGCRRTWAAAAGALPPPLPDDATATPCPSRARKKPTPAFLESGRRQSGSRRWGRALASLSCSLALPGRETSNSKSLGFLVEDEEEKGEGFVRRRRGGGFASCEANKYALGCSMWAYFGWAKGPNPRENTTVHFFYYCK